MVPIPFSSCLRVEKARRGFTLIELLAATAIIGVLLVGVVSIRARQTALAAKTEQRAAANRAADELLTTWFMTDPPAVPIDSTGPLSNSGLQWRTRVVPSRDAARLNARVVRLEVSDATSPLATVDILLAEKRP